jgi:hypothetical protein
MDKKPVKDEVDITKKTTTGSLFKIALLFMASPLYFSTG